MRMLEHTGRSRRLMAVAAGLGALLLAAGCGDKKEPTASQTAAKVNKEEITVHQINFALQQQRGLKPEQAEAAGRQVLERLIDQEIALQKAEEQKLDRDPRVVQQLEAARREVVARAYVEKVGEGAVKPTPEEVQQYFEDKPALFSQRRIYNLQEMSVEATPEQVPALREKLAAAKNMGEFVEYLRGNDYRFTGNQAVRAAEQLPSASLDSIARLKDGQAVMQTTPTGVHIVVLAGSRSQPVTLEQARPAIEAYLLNERRRKLVEDDVKALRAAAKVQYVGKFAEGRDGAEPAAADATAAASAPAAAPATPNAPSPAASTGLSATDIGKGLGIK